MMALAVQMDIVEHKKLSYRSEALIGRLGGEIAEPISHMHAACEALLHLWSSKSVMAVREAATGKILESLLNGRSRDWAAMLKAVEKITIDIPGLAQYIRKWARGHFLPGYC
jgi:cellulose synthase operon protein C